MAHLNRRSLLLAVVVAMGLTATSVRWVEAQTSDPLPSWSDGAAKQAIQRFVADVTAPSTPHYTPAEKRIATFDNDGTLWAEQPIYFEFAFSMDRVRATANQHPEWKTTQPFQAILSNDRTYLAHMTTADLARLVNATHTGMTEDVFEATAKDWLANARHPRFHRRYVDLVYQPQLELLSYLRANGFKTFIVTGGDVGFVRAFAEQVYGIPPEQVIGSSVKYAYQVNGGEPQILRKPGLGTVDDGPGKPINIQLHIGRRPLLAFGNSDGDRQMLEHTDTGDGPRLMLLLHHDDAEREWAYDRKSSIGRLDKALDEATKRGWIVVSIKNDFNTVFPAEK